MMLKKLALTAALATVVTLALAIPASASDVDPEPISAAEAALAPPSGAAEADGLRLAQLHALVGTQTQGEIRKIIRAGGAVYSLLDDETGRYLAAFVEEPTFSPSAIQLRGPGCATTDACANNIIGYYGTGQLTFSQPYTSITKVFAGNRITTWWHTATVGTYLNVNQTVYFTSPRTVVSITRS